MRQAFSILVCVSCVLAGCGKDTSFIPEKVDSVTLYSLECQFDRQALPDDAELLHGYLVLGKTEVSDGDKADVLIAIRDDIATGGEIKKCFDPHHAATLKYGDQAIDLVICFKCQAYERTVDGKLSTISFPMNVNSRDLLNRMLTAAGVKLSSDATAPLGK